MKKVGIVTFHNAHNFGAVLQCLALKTVIRNLGYECNVINYENDKLTKGYSNKFQLKPNNGILSIAKKLVYFTLLYFIKEKRISKFKSFIDKYILDDSRRDDNLSGYDYIVYGSDQIWRGAFTDNDLFYWGKTDNTKCVKISYAASAGKFSDEIDSKLHLLHEFSAISVREKDFKDYLHYKGIDANLCIDPTLLLSKQRWMSLIPIRNFSKPYIMVYSLRNPMKVLKVAKMISQKENMPIIEIFSNPSNYRCIFKEFNSGDPIDFLSLINGASYVVTDSFHGTVFSIIFNKQFVTVKLNDGNDNRSQSLLNELCLEERMSESGEKYNEPIDYSIVNSRLAVLRQKSMEFLEEALRGTPCG